MGSNFHMGYNVDIAMCIDATGSMRHVLDFVKENALNLYKDVAAEMEKKHKTIDQLRVRVIAFRDYINDGEVRDCSNLFRSVTDGQASCNLCFIACPAACSAVFSATCQTGQGGEQRQS